MIMAGGRRAFLILSLILAPVGLQVGHAVQPLVHILNAGILDAGLQYRVDLAGGFIE